MSVKISQKIVGYAVSSLSDAKSDAAKDQAERSAGAEVIQMHERLERPEILEGNTYKIRSPLFEHALYVTINDIVLNADTRHESRRPFEIFINSKNMEHFQWAVALTRIASAVFRKGGDVTFIVDELKAVFDPRGGYYKTGGVYMPSIVAELGHVIEQHLKKIGMITDDPLDDEVPETIRMAKEKVSAKMQVVSTASGEEVSAFPPHATLCQKCSAKAMVIMDGCATCLSCGYSKCG